MKSILAAVDLSELTDSVVEHAAVLASGFHATLHLLHVAAPDPDFVGYEAGPQTVRDHVAHDLREEHREVRALALRLREEGMDVSAHIIQGATVETILGQSKRHAVDLIVLGSHGRGAVYRTLMGSVCEGVLRATRCPLFIVPAGAKSPSAATAAGP